MAHKLYRSILLVIFFLLLGAMLATAEWALRKQGNWKTYTEKQNGIYRSPYTSEHETWYRLPMPHIWITAVFPEFTKNYFTNNEGCRDVDFNITKTKFRIITIGDSFTECLGSSNDSTWQILLHKQLPDNIRNQIEIWNAGSSGSDPVAEYALLKNRLMKYKPDLVVLTINSSDIEDVKIRGGRTI